MPNGMLDAIRNKRMGGINLTILVGEAGAGDGVGEGMLSEENAETPEMEAKELGLAPDAQKLTEDAGSKVQDPMSQPQMDGQGEDDDQMMNILGKGAVGGKLGKMGRKPGMVGK